MRFAAAGRWPGAGFARIGPAGQKYPFVPFHETGSRERSGVTRMGDSMPTALDQPADAMPTAHMGWSNPPADVMNAIEVLRQHFEAWPKTPIENPLHLVSGTADALCQAVTGHALFVPGDLAESICELGTFMVAAFIVLVVVIAGAVGFMIRQWAKYFPPRSIGWVAYVAAGWPMIPSWAG
jgi:hypothetical protein